MAERRSRSLALDADPGNRLRGGRLGRFSQRLARALVGVQDQEPTRGAELSRWMRDERGAVGEEVLPRFPLVRRGYDCTAVDELVGELEQQLGALHAEAADLRAQTASSDQVADEIKRIGEQTSGVLIAAHEQREVMLRAARTQADQCIADATSKARAITSEAEGRVRELEAQNEAAQRERDRLIEDARLVSTALAAVAQSAQERIPPKPDGATVEATAP